MASDESPIDLQRLIQPLDAVHFRDSLLCLRLCSKLEDSVALFRTKYELERVDKVER